MHPLKNQLINVIVTGKLRELSDNQIDVYGNPSFITKTVYLDLTLVINKTNNYFRSIMSSVDVRTDYNAYINKAWEIVNGEQKLIKQINISALEPELNFNGGKLSFIRKAPTLKAIEKVFGQKYSVIVEGKI
jgi:hypothetical protein